jgi:signal transduction histidine kinase
VYSELFLSRAAGGDQQGREIVTEIKKAGERTATIARQLLAFSRRQTLQPVVFDLNKFVAGLEMRLRLVVGGDIDLSTCLDDNLHPVKADPTQIEQVVMNLVANARDAMPQGGKLTIETRNAELVLDPGPDQVSGQLGPYALLAVTDNGCGMTDEVKGRLFEPFFTTKGTASGSGLGLATAYGILKQSGGHIMVSSEPGEGTTFQVYLPQVPAGAPVAAGEGSAR